MTVNLEAVLEKKIQEAVKAEVAKELAPVLDSLPKNQNKPNPAEGPEWLTAKDFCKKFSMSRSTLQRLKEKERVDVLYGGGRFVRYRWKEDVLNVTERAENVHQCGYPGGESR
jgi:molecular chaperone GrpE (heat shock protein)